MPLPTNKSTICFACKFPKHKYKSVINTLRQNTSASSKATQKFSHLTRPYKSSPALTRHLFVSLCHLKLSHFAKERVLPIPPPLLLAPQVGTTHLVSGAPANLPLLKHFLKASHESGRRLRGRNRAPALINYKRCLFLPFCDKLKQIKCTPYLAELQLPL